MTQHFPFTAIVGRDDMKPALILNIINPTLSGVLIREKKGTAKSTAVRALAEILPVIEHVKNCPFRLSLSETGAVCKDCMTTACPGQREKTAALCPKVSIPRELLSEIAQDIGAVRKANRAKQAEKV